MTSTIWVVLCGDGNSVLPETAGFLTKDEADAYAVHMSNPIERYAVSELKLMRFVPAKIEPAALDAILADPRSTETKG